MYKRSTYTKFTLGLSASVFSLLLATGLQMIGVTSRPAAIICFVLAGLALAAFCWIAYSEYWLKRKEKPLQFVEWSGGTTVTPSTSQRKYEWDYTVVIHNASEELPVGIKQIELEVKRKSWVQRLPPEGFIHPILSPLQTRSLQLHFSSNRPTEKEHKDAEMEYPTLLITDSKDNIYPFELESYYVNVLGEEGYYE